MKLIDPRIVVLTVLGPSLCTAPVLAQAGTTTTEHRIGIRKTSDSAEFFDIQTDETFVPRGNNYLRLRFDPTDKFLVAGLFLPEYHDAAAIALDFERMRALGYNTIRTFIDLCLWENCIAKVSGGLRDDFMDNVVSFLRQAKAHDLFVIFTANWLPDVGGYSDAHQTCAPLFDQGNCLLLSAEGVDGYRRFFRDFVQGLIDRDAPMDAILAYELRNEAFFEGHLPPLNLSAGSVKTANGKTYDMSSADDKRRMIDEGLIFWASETREAILDLDPTALVTAGFFAPNEPHDWRPGDTRRVQTKELLSSSALDFLDFHGYPQENLTFEQLAENYGMTGEDEIPIILGEFGAFLSDFESPELAAPHIVGWQADACAAGFDGYIYWLWDPSQTRRVGDTVWGPLDGNGEIGRGLAPVFQPDPCAEPVVRNLARGKPVVASRSLAESPPEQAVDGNPDLGWGSGEGPPQWIEVDLGSPETIGRIAMRTDQYPAGETVHMVSGQASPSGPSVQLHQFAGPTSGGDWLEVTPEEPWENVRLVRITTTVSPSWVSWMEIEIYSADTVVARPLPPTQMSPVDFEDKLPTMPTLSWTEVPGATSYRVQLADLGGFGKLIYESPDITETELMVGPLADSTRYRWRVRANIDENPGPWSYERQFTVGTIVNVGRERNDLPGRFRVSEMYPNPFRIVANIEVDLPQAGEIVFEIFDVLGRRVETVISGTFPAGRQELRWRPENVPAGVYMYRLTMGASRVSGKVLFLAGSRR